MIGMKGQMNLQGQINRLWDFVTGIHPIPVDVYRYVNCGDEESGIKTCSSGFGPGEGPGWGTLPYLDIPISELPTQPASIMANFEWTDPNPPGETTTWCCCFKYDTTGQIEPSKVSDEYSSLEIEDCTGVPCEECHSAPACTIDCGEIPALTPLFTTGLIGDVVITQSDSYNDGWNGLIVNIVNTSTCEVVATLSGPVSSGSPLVTTITLDFDTEFGIFIEATGDWPEEASLLIEQDGTTLLTEDPLPAKTSPGMNNCEWLQIIP